MSQLTRNALIATFDDARASFLAAIDQVVAEMRPRIADRYSESMIACARAFADPSMVRAQLAVQSPEVFSRATETDLDDAHLASLSYLLSLTLHELMKNKPEVPQP